MGAAREAFDLRNPACRKNFRRKWKGSNWAAKWYVLQMAWHDTRDRVCPPEASHVR